MKDKVRIKNAEMRVIKWDRVWNDERERERERESRIVVPLTIPPL